MKTKLIPFDINKAKAGAKVVTRNGLPAKILDYPVKNEDCPILGLVLIDGKEFPLLFTETGNHYNNSESCYDLSIEEEVEEDDSDYDPYKATVESIADMVERYSELQSLEELKYFYNNVKIKCRDAFEYDNTWCKKQDEKPADNKPKFHKGDWVISKQGRVQQITNVIENATNHTYGYDTISYSFGIRSYGYFNENVKDIRLWNIQDAKNGDVLYSGEVIFIFNKIDGEWLHCYCSCHKDGSFIRDYDLMTAKYFNEVHPATKEQHDLLFQKIKEEGYEWDSDKKELKKIEEVKTRRMTNQELSWWLREHPEEHREYCIEGETCVCFNYHYNSGNSNEEVDEYIRIRKNGGEWQEPLIEI